MQIRRTATEIEILAPAKVNLFFEVLNRRDDGFHEIETLMAPISLYDTLVLEDDHTGQVSLAARWTLGTTKTTAAIAPTARFAVDDTGDLPPEDENHVVRAVRLLAQRSGTFRGARLRLVKRIPAAAGLGGGSSDAAAALVAANLAWNLNWSTAELAVVGAELGSDVPFFLHQGPAICRGRGEQIEPIAGLGALHLVVVRPSDGLSTATVYGACRPGGPFRQVHPIVEALRGGRLAEIGPVTHNRLLEPARGLSPGINRVLDQLGAENCVAIGMSGSGTSCFGLCRSAGHARRVAAQVRSRTSRAGYWITSVCTV